MIDARKNIKKNTELNEVQSILKKHGNKSEALEALQQKSR